MEKLYLIFFFILGSIMGSFYHVLATRLSKGMSIIRPASHCEKCNHELKWYELIPILSYIFQGGKCRKCKTPLPLSYLLMEICSGMLFAVCYHVFDLKLELLDSQASSTKEDSIIEIKEYKKDFLTIGIALIKKEIIKPIDYSNVDNIKIDSYIKYYSKIMIIDDSYEIDNIMVKGFDKEIDAKNYFLELNELVNNNNLKELISIFKDYIS